MIGNHARAPPSLALALAAAALAAATGAGGCFDGAVPDGAVILCAADDDCPDGLTCALARHECLPPDGDRASPSLTSIAFDPPATNGTTTVSLTLVADEPLADDPAPVVRFVGGLGPPLGQPGGEGASRAFSIDAEALADGIFVVQDVELVDVAGNRALIPVDGAALEVDRRAPNLHEARLVDGPADGIYADIDSAGGVVRTRLTVELAADDVLDLGATEVDVGALRSEPCVEAAGLAGTIRCTVALDSPFTDDDAAAPVLVRAIDTAGNAGETVLFARVDTDAPTPITTVVTIEAPGVGLIGEAVPGSRVHVDIVVSEALSTAPTGVLRAGNSSIALALDSGSDQQWSLIADIVDTPAAADGVIELVLTDVVGHVSAALTLAEQVRFGSAILSDCPVPQEMECPDADGDGVSPIIGCNVTADCNDVDPAVFPGAPELAGDGLANDCEGEDDPVDETAGVFFDAAAPAGGSGTRAQPFNTASAAENSGAATVFLRGGLTDTDGFIRQTMIGGFDAAWEPIPGARSRLTAPAGVDMRTVEDIAMRRLRLDVAAGQVRVERELLACEVDNNNGETVAIEGAATWIDGDLDGVVVEPSSQTRVIDTRLSFIIDRGNLSLVRADVTDVTTLSAGATLVATSSFFHGGFDTLITCTFCAQLSLTHSTLLQADSRPVITSQGSGLVFIVGSALRSVQAGPLINLVTQDSTWVFRDNILSHQTLDTRLFATDTGTVLFDDVGALDACDDAGGEPWCGDVDDNDFVGPPETLAFIPGDEPHIELLSPLSNSSALHPSGATILDFDGDCRYDDAVPDTGADEAG